MRIFRAVIVAIGLAWMVGLSACGIGYNSMVFSTKSNAGLDVDTSPPTAQVSISRSEAVFAPAFEGGKTPPVMASFRSENEGLFGAHIGSAFAAGDAAVAMSTLWDQDVSTKDASRYDGTLVLSAKPQPPGEDKQLYAPGDVRPLLFGTDTSFGVKVAWSGLTAGVPDTLRVGFNRKELAWAPVTYASSRLAADGTVEQGHFVHVPSLLATIDTKVKAANPLDSNDQYVQYFATGEAATQLAMERDIREAMKPRFDPGLTAGTGYVARGAEDAADRLRAYAKEDANRRRLRAWLDERGVKESVTIFVNDQSYRALRREAVADSTLDVPPLSLPTAAPNP